MIMPSRNEADLEDVPEELRKGMTFVPVDRVAQVWEAAMGLRLDGKGAELAEANDLLEEASELLQQARRKAGVHGAAAVESPAAKAPVRKAAAKKAPVRKAAAKKAPAVAEAPPPPAKGGAKKTTAARGRGGRKR